MAPNLPRLRSPDDVPSFASSPSVGSKVDVVIILSSDDEQEASSLKSAGFKPEVITLSSSSDDEQEASSRKRSSSVVITLSSSELLGNCRKRRSSSGNSRHNVPWRFDDEVSILTALAAERLESGQVPDPPAVFFEAIRNRIILKRENPTARDVSKVVRNLEDKFKKAIASGGPSDDPDDRKLYDLSSKVWPELLPPV